MRRLLILAALTLVFAACGDDDAFGPDSTATTSATTAASTTTTAGVTTSGAAPDVTRDLKKDPADARVASLSKSARGIRVGGDAAPETIGPPMDRGDDPYLDGLWDDCSAGDMTACDDLYRESPVGSQYEAFGDTCGNRTGGGVWCADLGATQEPYSYGDDPFFDGLWDDCAAGDMTACDELYLDSPIDSEYEAFGFSCGYVTDGVDWCVDAFPVTTTDLAQLWDDCGAGDWDACDQLFIEAPIGSEEEEFGRTCGYRTDGLRWCTDEFFEIEGTYGSDAYFDGLWDDCAAGDWAACDQLFSESPVGSEYEDFGYTCGGLTDGSEWCVDASPAGAFGYGDDAYFDGLWDACDAGDWYACDQLYSESPFGSEYEDFGGTCGWLTDGTQWCVDVMGGGGDPYTYGDDVYFDGLWDACDAGDWAACDALYSESPVGSEYEDFGNTCGWLTDGTGWCVDVMSAGDPYTYGDDVYFDGLWDACDAGDWAACDALYSESPLGSEYEDFGNTCGWLTDGTGWCVDVMSAGDPYTYGDDVYFDGLWDACDAGDWAACDALYSESPLSSEYEDFGNTCGWLTDGTEWCVDVMSGGDPYTYGDDVYFDGLWDACDAGDWAACDALYNESPFDSEYEAFGDTCGYRTGGGEWCVDVMP